MIDMKDIRTIVRSMGRRLHLDTSDYLLFTDTVEETYQQYQQYLNDTPTKG